MKDTEVIEALLLVQKVTIDSALSKVEQLQDEVRFQIKVSLSIMALLVTLILWVINT